MDCVAIIVLASVVASVELSVVAPLVNTVVGEGVLLVVASIVVVIPSVDISVGAKV